MTDLEKQESRLAKKERILSRENLEQVVMEVEVSKALFGYAKERQKEVADHLENGQSIKVTNSRGVQVASVSRSNPQPKFVVEDMAVVLPSAGGAEIVDLLPSAGSVQEQEAIEVLREHAPHLLRVALTAEEEKRLAEEVQKEWEITGKIPAGWTIQEARPGVTSVRASKVGKEIVAHLLGDTKDVLALTEGAK